MSRIRAGFIILADIMLLTALVMIYYIDQMVNGTLYYFGLFFDVGWMQPYFLFSRLFVIVVIVAIVVVSLVELPISASKEKSG